VPFFVKPITSIVANKIQASWLDRQFAVHFPFLEGQLKTVPGTTETQKGGICGPKFNAADMLMSFPVIAATGREVYSKTDCPELVAYAGRLEKDPGYQKAVKKIEEVEGQFVSTL
jgi:glutathione S-transferase